MPFAFQTLQLAEVVAFTAVDNRRSEAVMQRLGMVRDPGTFRHPALPQDHRLSAHCLYRIRAGAAR
ncbi:GNAT family N-acetyltransferase [Pseudorhodoferax sp. Leaf274]|uniref:GNAT family N-acetyltransferase n=1 Tax=Pseudorhodoferax sp. Leaf274 TaxID=1736318 RepID=UPI000702B4D2|nr:GNAT family protein [Pseudorhodoferax sp. Leaf274]KQP38991.1 hypothetical protein ASF44_11245 [Pseudorhodoferax sp. Leaf274]